VNQDRFLCFKGLSDQALLWKDGFFSLRSEELQEYGYLFAIADGMGGHNAGEVASSQAIQLLWEQYYSGTHGPASDMLGLLKEIFHRVHEEIKAVSRSKFEYRGMGTTLTAAILKEGTLFYAHIGDSRLYKINPLESIQQLTEDHTLTAKGIREGLLNQEDIARNHKGALYQAIAVSPQLNVEVGQRKLSPYEWVLLCSDGLTDVVDERIIEGFCKGEAFAKKTPGGFSTPPTTTSPLTTPKEVCEGLMKAADEMGREDDVTIIAIKTE